MVKARGRVTGVSATTSERSSLESLPAESRGTAMAITVSAEIATVYRLLDGSLHHVRCGRRLVVQGRSTEELQCYCLTCAESVWLPLCALVRPAAADGTIESPWS